jgi:hypothetical protein
VGGHGSPAAEIARTASSFLLLLLLLVGAGTGIY